MIKRPEQLGFEFMEEPADLPEEKEAKVAELQKKETGSHINATGEVTFGSKRCRVAAIENWQIVITSIVENSGVPVELVYDPRKRRYEMAPGQIEEPGLIEAVNKWAEQKKASGNQKGMVEKSPETK